MCSVPHPRCVLGLSVVNDLSIPGLEVIKLEFIL